MKTCATFRLTFSIIFNTNYRHSLKAQQRQNYPICKWQQSRNGNKQDREIASVSSWRSLKLCLYLKKAFSGKSLEKIFLIMALQWSTFLEVMNEYLQFLLYFHLHWLWQHFSFEGPHSLLLVKPLPRKLEQGPENISQSVVGMLIQILILSNLLKFWKFTLWISNVRFSHKESWKFPIFTRTFIGFRL